ncbi:kinase-like protein [Gymnopus androsaceus JB14]|uniref:Kinase-like protein n=1 Tax=Gymnopus androsaceus JB14 TaxID=1447944 RepID=A0A6A4HWF5_9AGAR|nr:kinase-like protein [Gymnopus androsaceus JB14]
MNYKDIYRGTIGEESVCIKVLRLAMEQDEEIRDNIRKEFCKEALIWRQLKHPNILPLLGVNAELFSPSFCLISPWMENKDIITFLRKNPSHDRQNVLSEVAAGLCYLHSRDPPILHGDIRGANILVSNNFHCCLADFGLTVIVSDSRTFTNATTSAMTRGTTRWMAPELISSSADPAKINTSRDIYAFGCTVLEILTLQLPFHDKRTDPAVILSLIQGERPARPQNVWYPDPIWDLTTQCWAQEPTDRPNAQEILQTLHGSDASYGDAGSTAPRREYEPGPDWSQTPTFIQGLLDLPPPPNPTIQVQGPTINLTDLTEQTDHFRITTRNQVMQKHQTQTQTVVEPLDIQRFGVTYKHWCLTKNIVHDPRLLIIDSRPIDLFQLHCYVIREGGIQNVSFHN